VPLLCILRRVVDIKPPGRSGGTAARTPRLPVASGSNSRHTGVRAGRARRRGRSST